MQIKRNDIKKKALVFVKILSSLIFAWSISSIAYTAGCVAAVIVSTTQPISPVPSDSLQLFSACITILPFGTGAFCLGTLAKKTNAWLLAGLFFLPLLVFLGISATYTSEFPRPLCSVALGFIGSFCAIAAGQSTHYNRKESALDIPWYHWVWIFPTSLFQIYNVPLTLIFAFVNLDEFYSVPEERLVIRIFILLLLLLVLIVINNASKLLSSRSKLTRLQIVALILSWLFFTAPEATMLVLEMGKDMGSENLQ